MSDTYCEPCGKKVEPLYEDLSFDYSGTHCTGGRGGTYRDGYWYCPECEAKIEGYEPEKEYEAP